MTTTFVGDPRTKVGGGSDTANKILYARSIGLTPEIGREIKH